MTVLSYCEYDLEIILAAVNSLREIWGALAEVQAHQPQPVASLHVQGQSKSDSSALQSLCRLLEVYALTEI